MHLSPSAIDGAIRVLEQRVEMPSAVGEMLDKPAADVESPVLPG
jgi:hypothetical protein